MQRLGNAIDVPEVDAGEYLLDAMFRLGPIRATEMGERAADWPEIWAFARCTGAIDEQWEFETLHSMCAAYHDERQAAKDPLRIAPASRSRE